MNILLAVTNLTTSNGGVTPHVVDLYKELSKRGHNVICLYDKTDENYPDLQ